MSWGSYEPLVGVIEHAQAATIMLAGTLGVGSGVMINERFAITAAHVVMDPTGRLSSNLTATNIWSESLSVKKVVGNVGNDFAIVELDHPFAHTYAAKIAATDAASGDQTFVVGHPFNVTAARIGWAVSFGTADGALFNDHLAGFDMDTLRGYSGGGIFNARGELVSVLSGNTSVDVRTGQNFASPYFTPTVTVYNEVLNLANGTSTLGVINSVIQSYLVANGITNQPGGDASLPVNQPDPVKQPFLTPAELAQVELAAPASRLSTVAIGSTGRDLIHSGLLATGVLISQDLVLTNLHVVEGDKAFVIGFPDREIYTDCSTVMASPTLDMAIIKLSRPAPAGFVPVQLATTGIDAGEPAYTVGNPADLWYSQGGWQVTAAKGYGLHRGDLYLHGTSAFGNSGGGIFDVQGRLAGLLWAGGELISTNPTWDRQDPHETAFSPSAQSPTTDVLGVDYSALKEFVSAYVAPKGQNGAADYAYASAIQADGKILVAGRAYSGANNDIALIRYNSDGSRDGGFGSNGVVLIDPANSCSSAASVLVRDNGKILLAGTRSTAAGSDFVIVQLDASGRPDSSVGVQGVVAVDFTKGADSAQGMALQDDGKIVVAGSSFDGTTSNFAIARLNADGSLDSAFGNNGRTTTDFSNSSDFARDVAIQKDGKIVVAGYCDVSGKMDFALARYTKDGMLDTTFGDHGKVTTDWGNDEAASGLVIQSDGKIVVVGYAWSWATPDIALARYNSDGSLDTSFSGDGKLTQASDTGNDYGQSIKLQQDGKIVVGGRQYDGHWTAASPTGSYDFSVLRYNPDGTLDPTFSGDGVATVDTGGDDFGQSLLIQTDGSIVASGYSTSGADVVFSTVRLSASGTPDSPFNAATSAAISSWLKAATPSSTSLIGTALPDTLVAGGGNDTIDGGSGNDSIDGGNGIDTAIYRGSRSSFTLTKTSTGFSLNDSTGSAGTDTLTSVERIKFSDGGLALDVGATQAAGQTVLMLGAVLPGRLVFDVAKQSLLGAAIDLFDQGYSLQTLSGAVMRLPIWDILTGKTAPNNTDIANYLLTNVNNGVAPDASTLANAVTSLDAENSFATQGNFLWHLAESSSNQTHVDLIGLASAGLAYTV